MKKRFMYNPTKNDPNATNIEEMDDHDDDGHVTLYEKCSKPSESTN